MKKFILKIVNSADYWPLVAVIAFGVLAARSLIFQQGYFNMHDDLQMMRQLEMEKCFFDGQIPCRWVPDMGYGYGFPLFNFYPPLPYLVGQVFRVLQFSFVDTAKLTFALSFILSGVTMYFLSREFFGKRGALMSSVFYVWAPYHSVDVYVRGAMNESWALVWFPLILFTGYKLIIESKKPVRWIISLSLSWVGLLLSHNLMVMIFTPVFGVWCLMWWLQKRDIKKIWQLAVSGFIALCLAAFFTLPAIIEQKYIHVDTLTQGYYEYIAHFATIGQLLFSRAWGYGPSIWGPEDGMPFMVGHLHWFLSILIVVISSFVILKKKFQINKNILLVIIFSFSFAWFAAFMAHQNSTFIWQKIKPLAFVQFPWRFLTLVMLGFSLLAGSLSVITPKNTAKAMVTVSILLVVIINWSYFRPQGGHMGPLTDKEKFAGAAWDLQRTAGIFDYLPNTAKQNPKDPPMGVAEFVSGRGSVVNSKTGTDWASFEVQNTSESVVRVNLFDFPNWKLLIDGSPSNFFRPDTELYGRMFINIPTGNHNVYLKLTNTPIRTVSNIISLIAWLALCIYVIMRKKYA